MSSGSAIAELTSNVLETPFESFDAATVARARKHVIDVVGCALGGAHAPGCAALRELLGAWGGRGDATVLGHALRLPAPDAALLNGILARSYDFEPCGAVVDGHATPAHLSGTTVPTALAVAEQYQASGKQLLSAVILGDDMAARIAAASSLDLDAGFDPTGTVNVFGATAVAGRLRGLDAKRMRHAFGIALNQMSGTFQNVFDGALSFKLPQGLAARAGIFAVELAARGYTGVEDPLFSAHGYFALYGRQPQPELLTRHLGSRFYANNTFKPYPCCRSNHAAIDAALELARTHDLAAEDIEDVLVDVAPIAYGFAVGRPLRIGEVAQVSASFSLSYATACALLRRSVLLEHFTESAIRDPRIAALVRRIRLSADGAPEQPLAASVTVTTKDGRSYRVHVSTPSGSDLWSPLGPEHARQKFMQNVRFSNTVAPAQAERALTLLERLDELDHLSVLVALLRGDADTPRAT